MTGFCFFNAVVYHSATTCYYWYYTHHHFVLISFLRGVGVALAVVVLVCHTRTGAAGVLLL
jgi:hypothetical protein